MRKIDCILLVDDDDATNFYNKKIVEHAGIVNHIRVAEDGVQALDYMRKSLSGEFMVEFPEPDLILSDINMPRMNGWEFIAEYKKIKTSIKKRVVVAMLTTSLSPDDARRSEEIGEIAAFRNKPLTPKMLVELVESFF